MEISKFVPKCLIDFSQSVGRIYDEVQHPKNVNLVKDITNVFFFVFRLGMTVGIYAFLKPATPFESRFSLKRVVKWAGCVMFFGKASTNMALGSDLLLSPLSRNANTVVNIAGKLLGVGVLLSAKDSGERTLVEDYMKSCARSLGIRLNKRFFPNAGPNSLEEEAQRL
jgi:hypothetical protein